MGEIDVKLFRQVGADIVSVVLYNADDMPYNIIAICKTMCCVNSRSNYKHHA